MPKQEHSATVSFPDLNHPGPLHIHVHLCDEGDAEEVRAIAARIEDKLDRLLRTMQMFSKEVDSLIEEVAKDDNVHSSAVKLLNSLADQIDQAKGDRAKVAEIVAHMRSRDTELADAVVRGTPVDTTTGEGGADTTTGGGGTDTSGGSGGTDTSTGSTGDDTLSGGNTGDTLGGGTGEGGDGGNG